MMIYRKETSDWDYGFGKGDDNFFVDSIAGVAQAIKSRLLLATGEWPLDTSEGTPYSTKILGMNRRNTYDAAFKARILGTTGVISIADYSSSYDESNRSVTVSCTVNTTYGTTTVVTSL